MSQPTEPTTARGMLARYWQAAVWGAIGIFLGLWTGNWGSALGMQSLGVLFPLAASVLVGVISLAAAARAGNRFQSRASLALVIAWCLGFLVAPRYP